MRTSVRVRMIVASAMLAMAGSACGGPFEFLGVGGSRIWIITVVNDSPRPAVLAVAKAEGPMGDIVGSAEPPVVPAGATVEVRFAVPAGQGWAIFVNPGPNIGALVGSSDVPPDRNGKLPLTISIAADGNPSVSAPGEPGWFGG